MTHPNPSVGMEAVEAEAQFPLLLSRVAAGEEITIMQGGNPVARLAPIRATNSLESREQIILKMRELASRNRLDDLTIRDLIVEGRR